MLLSGRVLFSLLMLAIFATMVAMALSFPPDSRFAPLVIGIPGILLTLGQLFVDVRERYQTPRQIHAAPATAGGAAHATTVHDGPSEQRAASPIRRELVLFAYFFGLVAGVVLFGFWVAIPVFILAFLRFHQREEWPFALSLTAVGSVVLYLVFEGLLSIVLHEGFVTRAVLDWFAQ